MLFYILLFTFFSSILSLFLVATLLLHKRLVHTISFPLVSFAAGALLATGFLDTLKEAVAAAKDAAFFWVTFSIAFFFLIERLFLVLHHHAGEEKGTLRLPAALLLLGDALHNFIDGAAIAVSFLTSFPLGIITSLAVFVHEIPHELGDFGILIHQGWKRRDVLGAHIATSFVSVVGALLTFYFGSSFHTALPLLLSVVAGNFIYLSATDLLPEIHQKERRGLALPYMVSFFLGIFLIALLIRVLG